MKSFNFNGVLRDLLAATDATEDFLIPSVLAVLVKYLPKVKILAKEGRSRREAQTIAAPNRDQLAENISQIKKLASRLKE
jgi:hypothetical protein